MGKLAGLAGRFKAAGTAAAAPTLDAPSALAAVSIDRFRKSRRDPVSDGFFFSMWFLYFGSATVSSFGRLDSGHKLRTKFTTCQICSSCNLSLNAGMSFLEPSRDRKS